MSLEGQSGKFCIGLLPNRKINKKLNTVLLRFRKALKQEQQIKAEKTNLSLSQTIIPSDHVI